jgi:hypothetical protein
VLKEHTSIDDNGSLHIHVNLHDWYECVGLNDIQKYYRALGYVLLANSGSDEVCCFLNYILDKVGKVFGITLNEYSFDYNIGYLKGTSEFDSGKGNRRSIGFLNDDLYSIADDTKYYGDYLTYRRKISGQADNVEERLKQRIPASSWKLNWINMRANPTTIEYRAGPCTFDYSEIINYCIECNRITKELLNFIDYIGERTIRTAVLP